MRLENAFGRREQVIDFLFAPFADFGFMRRALVGAVALAVSGTPLGLFLLLRRLSLSGDAISHAILPGAALGYLLAGLSLPAMTIGGFAAGCLVALAAAAVARLTALREDASLAAFYLLSLALGVTIVSLRGSNVDLLHILFGNVLALDDSALVFIAAVATLSILGMAVLYRALVVETFDPAFLAVRGRAAALTQGVFFGLVVLHLVGGFYALGSLMAVGLMMLPAAGARLWTNSLDRILVVGAFFGALASWAGLAVSFRFGLPSGPVIVLCAGILYLASVLFGPAGGLVRLAPRRRHLEG